MVGYSLPVCQAGIHLTFIALFYLEHTIPGNFLAIEVFDRDLFKATSHQHSWLLYHAVPYLASQQTISKLDLGHCKFFGNISTYSINYLIYGNIFTGFATLKSQMVYHACHDNFITIVHQ